MGSGAIRMLGTDDCVLVHMDEIQSPWSTTGFACETLRVKVGLSM